MRNLSEPLTFIFLAAKLYIFALTAKYFPHFVCHRLYITAFSAPRHLLTLFVLGIHPIGYITKDSLGCALICRDGVEMALKAQGWNPLAKKD